MKKINKQGLTAAALAAALAAGTYYFYGSKNAKEHRRKTAEWAKKAKDEIAEKTKELRDKAFTRENYQKIVSAVGKKYQALYDLSPDEAKHFVDAVKKAWNQTSGSPAPKKRTSASKKRTTRASAK